MQLAGDSSKTVLQAGWLQDMAGLGSLGAHAKLGTVSVALYTTEGSTMCLWARDKIQQYQDRLHGTWQRLASQQVYGFAC